MEKEFSFYKSIVSTGNHLNQTVNLEKVYGLIMGNEYKDQILAIRAESDKGKQVELKKLLNYFTVSGIFEPGTRQNSTIVSHSGFMQIDFDFKDNPNWTAADMKAAIANDEYLRLIFISPTGTGVKAVASVPSIVERHLESFLFLESYFKARYELVIDDQCKDTARPFFISYDAAVILKSAVEISLPVSELKLLNKGELNDAALFITSPKVTNKEAPALTKVAQTSTVETDYDKKIRHIEKLCLLVDSTGIDMTGEYDFYLRIGFAIADGLGEDGRHYYHHICKHYPSYKAAETDKQFEACKKPGKVKWASLFGISSDYGLIIYPPKVEITPAVTTTPTKEKTNKVLQFWKVIYSFSKDEKVFKGIEVDDLNLLKLLKNFGFRRYDLEGGFSFVHVKDNIVREVQLQNVQDAFLNHLKTLPEKIDKHVTRDALESLIIKKSETLFGKQRLSFLTVDEPINFNKDTKNESFVYYKNGFVKCIPGSISFHQYCNLQKYIWKAQLKDRDFTHLANNEDDTCFYEKFIWNVSGKDLGRFSSLMTLIGYLLHDYKEAKLKAVVLTDSKLSDGNNGRTGKTLFGKAIEQIRDVCELNGKEFKADKSFKYQEAKLSTQIMFLNDAMTRFNLETIYNDITEGITIEKKNQNPVKLKVKYLITTNDTIKTNGASGKDRIIEYEFADYYSDTFHPKDEFGHWFFSDWNKAEWNSFDNFMMNCIALFLENGIINSDPVNLQNRKLIDQTCKQFFDFVESGKIMSGVKFCLQTLCDDFNATYPDYDFRTKYPSQKFAKWLKLLPEHHLKFMGLEYAYQNKSNKDHFYIFQNKPLVLKI